MTFINDMDPEIHADVEQGCIVFAMHPTDAATIAHLLRKFHADDPADEFVAEFTEGMIDQINQAVWDLGWDAHSNSVREEPNAPTW